MQNDLKHIKKRKKEIQISKLLNQSKMSLEDKSTMKIQDENLSQQSIDEKDVQYIR